MRWSACSTRLAHPDRRRRPQDPMSRETLIERVAELMVAAGLNLGGSRMPDEIADRYLEKQALDAAPRPRAHAEAAPRLPRHLRPARAGARPHRRARPPARHRARGRRGDPPRSCSGAGRAAAQGHHHLRRRVLAAPRLLHRHRLRDDRQGRRPCSPPAASTTACSSASAPPSPVAASGCAVWIDRLAEEARMSLTLAVPSRAASKS